MTINPNIAQFMQLMQKSQSPQQAVMNMLEGQMEQSNPIMKNLLSMAKTNDSRGIEQVARNLMKEKGLDFDTEFNNFKKTLGF